MWIVIKYKRNEFNFLKKGLTETLGNLPIIFRPKVKFQKLIKNKIQYIENDILEDYLLCYDGKFTKNNILNQTNQTVSILLFCCQNQIL